MLFRTKNFENFLILLTFLRKSNYHEVNNEKKSFVKTLSSFWNVRIGIFYCYLNGQHFSLSFLLKNCDFISFISLLLFIIFSEINGNFQEWKAKSTLKANIKWTICQIIGSGTLFWINLRRILRIIDRFQKATKGTMWKKDFPDIS